MAQCILCKATIPDGTQYCENCYPKVKGKADESYLDQLLNSVTTSSEQSDISKQKIYKTKEHKKEKRETMNDDILDGVPNDYNIFSKSDDDSDLDFLNELFDNAIDQSKSKKEKDNATSDVLPDIVATETLQEEPSEDLPEFILPNMMDEVSETVQSLELESNESMVSDELAASMEDSMESTMEPTMEDTTEAEIEPSYEEHMEPVAEPSLEENMEPMVEPSLEESMEPMVEPSLEESIEPIMEPFTEESMESTTEPPVDPLMEDSIQTVEETQANETHESLSPDESAFADSLLSDLNLDEYQEPEKNPFQQDETQTSNTDADELSDNDRDILDLINEINNTEELPPVEDITNYSDHSEENYHTEEELSRKNSTDIGDVFSDALGAVSSLNDNEEPIIDDDLLSIIPDIGEKSSDIKESTPVSETKKTTRKKRGLISRLFGNIKEERTEEEIEELKQKAIQEGEQKEAEKKAKEEAAKEKKERDKLQKAEDAKKAKEEATRKKQEKEKKAKEKKEAKEQRSREIQELIDEIDENEGKINKIGAGIIFALFAAIAVVIVIGTNIYSYSLAIKNAKNNFEIQHYNEAYKNVYGIDIKDEDIEIYDKIMTVMFVNKQLNSYENYYNMKKYPQALDSLLKGLERYDKYYSLAQLLGIESDLDYVRSEILEKLDTTFDVSIEEANMILSYEDQAQYSAALYELLSNRVPVTTEENSQSNN